jgi:hypothetical protein
VECHSYRLAPRTKPVPRQPLASPAPILKRLDTFAQFWRRLQSREEPIICRQGGSPHSELIVAQRWRAGRRSDPETLGSALVLKYSCFQPTRVPARKQQRTPPRIVSAQASTRPFHKPRRSARSRQP